MAKVCEQIKANGEQCRGPAIWGSEPVRCSVHRKDGGPKARPFKKGNQYAHLKTKHGFRRQLFSSSGSIEEMAADILIRHEQISAYIAGVTNKAQLPNLWHLHMWNIGRLLRLLWQYHEITGQHPDKLLEVANGEPKARLWAKLENLRKDLETETASRSYPKTKKRSPRYWLVYEFIVSYIEQHGVGPTFSEIKEACHIPTNISVSYWLEKLEDDGLIVRQRGVSRGIELLD